MRDTRLTRRAQAALAHYKRNGCRVEYHAAPYTFVVVEATGRRLVFRDDYEVSQPATERLRELVKSEEAAI
jgi:hypothetical protein